MRQLTHFINGQPATPNNGKWLDVFNPANATAFAQVADGNGKDVAQAILAAEHAQPAWASLPASERGRWLARLADALEAHLEDFARAESLDTGKPLSLTRQIEIPRSVRNLRFFSEAAGQFHGESYQGETGLNIIVRKPLGVVACISPWNLPLYLLTWKIAPALATGNAVIAKPSEVTPLTATLLGELAAEIGFPAGVLNILHGTGKHVGEALVKHPKIKAVSFTGSTAVGRHIAKITASGLKKVSLELGGKNPVLVFADSAWRENLPTLVRAAFQNAGQICLCGSRFLIEASIYDEFKAAFVAAAQVLVVDAPENEAAALGPLVSQAHFDKVSAAIATALAEGGKLLCGGNALHHAGWFIAPTVLEGLAPSSQTNQHEIFGPVVTLQAFSSDEQALALANASEYGLAASVWTQNLTRAMYFSNHLEVGIVWVNSWMSRDLRTPFGGVKQSGLGREGGIYAMQFFTEPCTVCIHPSGVGL